MKGLLATHDPLKRTANQQRCIDHQKERRAAIAAKPEKAFAELTRAERNVLLDQMLRWWLNQEENVNGD